MGRHCDAGANNKLIGPSSGLSVARINAVGRVWQLSPKMGVFERIDTLVNTDKLVLLMFEIVQLYRLVSPLDQLNDPF